MCAGLFALATPLIHLLYPSDYWAAAAPLAILAILSTGRVLIDFVYDLFAGIGRSRSLMALQALWLAALIVGLPIGANVGGLPGVAVAHVIVCWGIMVPAYALSAGRSGIPFGGFVRSVARPVLAAVLAAGAGVGVIDVVGTGIAGFLTGGITVLVVYALTAARPRDLLTLPKRFMRFEAPAPSSAT